MIVNRNKPLIFCVIVPFLAKGILFTAHRNRWHDSENTSSSIAVQFSLLRQPYQQTPSLFACSPTPDLQSWELCLSPYVSGWTLNPIFKRKSKIGWHSDFWATHLQDLKREKKTYLTILHNQKEDKNKQCYLLSCSKETLAMFYS